MSDVIKNFNEPMLDIFVFETNQMIDQLESITLGIEKNGALTFGDINEIFRIMHTIKGSSAMMMFEGISKLTHSAEDLFYYIRENKNLKFKFGDVCETVFIVVDYVKNTVEKIVSGERNFQIPDELISCIKLQLDSLKKNSPESLNVEETEKNNQNSTEKKQKYYISTYNTKNEENLNKYKVTMFFEDNCQMENIRAYTVVHNLKDIATNIAYFPEDIMENDETANIIRNHGFEIFFTSDKEIEVLNKYFNSTLFLKDFSIEEIEEYQYEKQNTNVKMPVNSNNTDLVSIKDQSADIQTKALKQTMISVNVEKLDMLMDLVGEIVISEEMVTRNPEIQGLHLDNFNKAAMQLRKLTDELQDIVMSIRMVPVSPVFLKMQRLIRDMGKKLNKDVDLVIIGENTEVDKNIIDNISDPLMHLIRNAVDHGIETPEERIKKGKDVKGLITLEAKNTGGDVYISVKDDGKGLNKEKILNKAREAGLINKPENELTDKEIFGFIMMPGFSTKENVTEFSGRGVGMDVVKKNIEKVGGVVATESVPDVGTTITIKIPLTLAIIDGMAVAVGKSLYTVPTIAIRESFRASRKDVISDTNGNELIMIRGECYPILRLQKIFSVSTDINEFEDGIIIVVEGDSRTVCLFADEILGEQQVVVKALPSYIKKIRGITGCTILGDGSISLIIDVNGIADNF